MRAGKVGIDRVLLLGGAYVEQNMGIYEGEDCISRKDMSYDELNVLSSELCIGVIPTRYSNVFELVEGMSLNQVDSNLQTPPRWGDHYGMSIV